jgi:protein MpaA
VGALVGVAVAGCAKDGRGAPTTPTTTAPLKARPTARVPERRVRVLGRSALGRPIRVIELGDGRTVVLVVGCIHGTECEGEHITQRLSRTRAPRNVRLLIVNDLNPDGHALGTRVNGRGVDLNRNFASQWRPIGVRGDPQYSGPRPLSEPETRVAARLVERARPTITIWYHQPQAIVRAWGHSVSIARRYARLAGAPFRRLRWPAGTAPNWQNHRFADASSFVVELPSGSLSATAAARHAGAVIALARASAAGP